MSGGLAPSSPTTAADTVRPPVAGASRSVEPRLIAKDVTVRHGRRVLIEQLELNMLSGDVAHLAGPNGSGKSSLIRVLAGLDPRARGALSTSARRAFVAEKVALAPTITVGAWLESMRRMRGAPPKDWEVELGRSGLDPTVTAFAAGRLSKGMTQRVALVEALTGPVDLVLLDEPFSGLDDTGRRWLCDAINRRAARDGCAFLLTDHSGVAASQLAVTHRLLLRDLRVERLPAASHPPATARIVRISSLDAQGVPRTHRSEPDSSDQLITELVREGHHITAVEER